MGEMTRAMSAQEEMTWIARCRDTPLPTQQIVAQLAQIAMYLFYLNHKTPAPRKGYQPPDRSLSDFMLFYRKRVSAQEDVEDQLLSTFTKIKDE